MFFNRSLFVEQLVTNPVFFFRFVVIIVISICLHELAHGAAALYQGDDTPEASGHMTLNPVVHMGWPSLIMLMFIGMAWGQMPVNPSRFKDGSAGRMMVAAAGPLMNFAIAAACIVVLNMFQGSTLISLEFFFLAAYINVGLGIFNMLPVPPLDGFTVFSEFFPALRPLRKDPKISIILIVLLFTGLLSGIWTLAAMIVNRLA